MADALLAALTRLGTTGLEGLSRSDINEAVAASPSCAGLLSFISSTLARSNIVGQDELQESVFICTLVPFII
jgi:hypothetical protein